MRSISSSDPPCYRLRSERPIAPDAGARASGAGRTTSTTGNVSTIPPGSRRRMDGPATSRAVHALRDSAGLTHGERKALHMTGDTATRASSAYVYPLTIRELLLTGVRRAPDQQIVYADERRLTYREFEERIGRLGSALAALGVGHGHTVAVMDWDTNRYLECFFAVPMMGAVLHTVNVRLSPEQVLYTINHAPDDMILVNGEFLPAFRRPRRPCAS